MDKQDRDTSALKGQDIEIPVPTPTDPYPECTRLAAVAPYSQKIGDFLDWLQAERGVHLLVDVPHEHDESCRYRDHGFLTCGLSKDGPNYVYFRFEMNALLAEYFGIDLDKVEAERQQLLASLRG